MSGKKYRGAGCFVKYNGSSTDKCYKNVVTGSVTENKINMGSLGYVLPLIIGRHGDADETYLRKHR